MDALGTDHAHQFARRQHQIHVAPGFGVHRGQLAFLFFGHAGHDGNAVQLIRRYAQFAGKVVLGHCAEHLLRALGGRKPVGPLRVMALEVTHPAGAATREHRQVARLARLVAVQELGAFLHDRQIGAERGVEHIVKAQPPQRRHNAVHGGLLRRQAQVLAPGGAHGGRDLHHGDLVGVGNGVKRLAGVVALAQRAGGAVGDALAAQSAVALFDAAHAADVDAGAAAGAGKIPHMHALDLIAHLDAAHALDALVGVAVQREIFGPQGARAGHKVGGVGVLQNAQVVGDVLQVAVAAARAGGAVAVVLAQDQFDVDAPGAAHAVGVGVDGHALKHGVVAAGHQVALALDLHTADAAGADLIEVLEVAQVGDIHPGGLGGVQDRGAFGHLYGGAVDSDVYHCVVLPPLKMP